MIIKFQHGVNKYCTDLSKPISIGILLKNGDDNPNCFWAKPVDISTIVVDDFVGSVAQGGSTNYQRIALTPHGNGTHTECYGHISADSYATIDKCMTSFHFVAVLISVSTTLLHNGDQVVRHQDFVQELLDEHVDAVILRTLPNDTAKRTKKYSGNNPPYIDSAIATELVTRGVKHFLLDLPSVDREEDGGKLSAHREFWQVGGELRKTCTITELIYVADSVKDGLYLLNIQIPNISIDAVPSNPTIYPLKLC